LQFIFAVISKKVQNVVETPSDMPKAKKHDKKDSEKKAEKKAAKKVGGSAKEKGLKAPRKRRAPVLRKKRPVAAFDKEDIALRAYFIAERRQAMGWDGDETSDWVEAERQLSLEAEEAARQNL